MSSFYVYIRIKLNSLYIAGISLIIWDTGNKIALSVLIQKISKFDLWYVNIF